jgi:hypothetical protein
MWDKWKQAFRTATVLLVLLIIAGLWWVQGSQYGYGVAAQQCRQVMQQYR